MRLNGVFGWNCIGKHQDEPSDDFFCVVTHETSMHKQEHKHKCILMQLKLQADTTITTCRQSRSRAYTQAHPYCTLYHICSLTVTLTWENTHTRASTYQRTNFGDCVIRVCKGVAPNGCVSVISEWSRYWAFHDFSLPSIEMQ